MLRRKRAAKAVEAAGGQDPRGEKRGGQLGKETRSLEEAVFGLVEAADVLGAGAAVETVEPESEREDSPAESRTGAAWVDDDDDDVTVDISARSQARKLRRTEEEGVMSGTAYSKRLREHFEKTHGSRPGWADVGGHADGDGNASDDSWTGDDDEERRAIWTRRKVPEVRAKRMLAEVGPLPKDIIDISRRRDANIEAPNKAAVQAAQFHPSAPVMVTAGYDSTLRAFQIDGKTNPLLVSVHIPDLPIASAAFIRDGKEVILSGRRRFLYVYELETGSMRKVPELQGRAEKSFEYMFSSADGSQLAFTGLNGEVVMVSPTTKQVIGSVKMNGSARAVAFRPDGKMLTAGSDGKVYVWDARNRKRCMHVFSDDGAISCSALAVSHDDRYVACGSDSGVVNIYNDECYRSGTPSPLKAIMNLTTVVHRLAFHPKNDVLAISSRTKKQAFRLFHVPSLTTFQNWPPMGTQLGYVNALSFSPGGGYLTTGNDKGKAMLFRLNHFNRA